MVSMPDSYITAFKSGDKQEIQISVFPMTGDDVTLTGEDIVQGSFVLNRTVISGSSFTIGTAVAGELQFTISSNSDYLDTVYEGAFIIVQTKPASVEGNYVTIGVFTVDEVTVGKYGQLGIVALDYMVKFDKYVDGLSYERTVTQVLNDICTACSVAYNSSDSTLLNSSVVLSAPTSENVTYRQVLIWIAQITGTCAFIDEGGKLCLKQIDSSNTNNAYRKVKAEDVLDHSLDQNDVTITGVSFEYDGTVYQYGSNGYVIAIKGNELIGSETTARSIASAFSASRFITYGSLTSASLVTVAQPWIMPLDYMYVTDGTSSYPYFVIAMEVTHTLNGHTTFGSAFESAEKKGYASQGAFTASQQAIIEQVKAIAESGEVDISDNIQAVLRLNEAVNNGMMAGGYSTTQDGITYYHDQPLLADSTYICYVSNNAFAFTTSGWNDGSPVWETGITADGSAVLTTINSTKINADLINAGTIDADRIDAGTISADKLVIGSITEDYLADDAVTSDKLADAVNTEISTASSNASSAVSTANAVDSTIASWCYNNNRTYINGSNIYTGTVNALQIAANAITADKLYASDAMLEKLMAYEATVDGTLYINTEIPSNSGGTLESYQARTEKAWKNMVALGQSTPTVYDRISGAALKIAVSALGSILAQSEQGVIMAKTIFGYTESNTFYNVAEISPNGFVFHDPTTPPTTQPLFGTCSDSTTDVYRDVTCSLSSLTTGAIIFVYFTYAFSTTYSYMNLNVNSLGSKRVVTPSGSQSLGTDYHWSAGDTVAFIYTGTYWKMLTSNAYFEAMGQTALSSFTGTTINANGISAPEATFDTLTVGTFSPDSVEATSVTADGFYASDSTQLFVPQKTTGSVTLSSYTATATVTLDAGTYIIDLGVYVGNTNTEKMFVRFATSTEYSSSNSTTPDSSIADQCVCLMTPDGMAGNVSLHRVVTVPSSNTCYLLFRYMGASTQTLYYTLTYTRIA